MNSLIYEEGYDYLNDLQIPKKRRYYPTNAESSGEFSHLVVPASPFIRNSIQTSNFVPKNDKTTPLSGNWSQRKSEPSLLEPAGKRLPKEFERR